MSNRDYDVTVYTIQSKTNISYCKEFDGKQKFSIKRFRIFKYPILTYIFRIIDIFKFLKRNKFKIIVCSGKFSLWLAGL